jgi:hypothetical protein
MPFIDDGSKRGFSASVFTIRLERNGEKHPVIFFTGPNQLKRRTLGIHCSWDGRKCWTSEILVNPGEIAVYSVMSEIRVRGEQKLLIVCKMKPNVVSYTFDLDWCKKP